MALMGWAIFAFVFVGLPAIFVVLLVLSWRKNRSKVQQIAADERVTQGVVVRKVKFTQVIYRFRDGLQQEHEGLSDVLREHWHRLETGGPVEIVYCGSQPQVSMLMERYQMAKPLLQNR